MEPNETHVVGTDEERMSKKNEASDLVVETHYVFLVHGWLGNDLEMLYIESAFKKAIASHEGSNGAKLVVHCTVNNNGRTSDGIRKGGTRLAKEVEDFIRSDNTARFIRDKDCASERHVTISFVGNSLGGLYSRYAISCLPTLLEPPECINDTAMEQSRIVIHRNLFCTTATPHLGVASHTYLPIPRFAERVIGNTLSKTGKDLFRLTENLQNDTIYQMSTSYEKFLMPLSQFQKRIAYINAFGTDFQVPTSTAAFISQKSAYPHHVIFPPLEDNETSIKVKKKSFVVALVSTEQNLEVLKEELDQNVERRGNDDLEMSKKLDALGW
eukprot:CAMPEP_0194441400 /NCGR_PEP_ID=MMETSP0176-20130528/121423_1 /TAXON_ID=216777 /ORGANISM="Proboscia alata, Strain PI-D3" /LENGTH=326 /DNA_ID=CAMNT_0039266711 /DNA_START=154 /DNA_END=1131 /DNA_ORIENTATION=-